MIIPDPVVGLILGLGLPAIILAASAAISLSMLFVAGISSALSPLVGKIHEAFNRNNRAQQPTQDVKLEVDPLITIAPVKQNSRTYVTTPFKLQHGKGMTLFAKVVEPDVFASEISLRR
jgi:hypothetical protein